MADIGITSVYIPTDDNLLPNSEPNSEYLHNSQWINNHVKLDIADFNDSKKIVVHMTTLEYKELMEVVDAIRSDDSIPLNDMIKLFHKCPDAIKSSIKLMKSLEKKGGEENDQVD